MAKAKVTDVEANSNEFLETRQVGAKIKYAKRKKIVMLETSMRLEKGKQYDIFHEKADYLIDKGVAKEVK